MAKAKVKDDLELATDGAYKRLRSRARQEASIAADYILQMEGGLEAALEQRLREMNDAGKLAFLSEEFDVWAVREVRGAFKPVTTKLIEAEVRL